MTNIISENLLTIICSVIVIISLCSIGLVKKKSKVPIELHKFLTVGALYYAKFSDSVKCADINKLKSVVVAENATIQMLSNDWGIDSKEDAVKMITAGINGNIQANYIDRNLIELKTMFDVTKCIENTEKAIGTKFDTAYAWDLERAAMLVRDSHSIGLLSEEETIAYLKQIISKAQMVFESWEQYAVSFVVGRIIWLNLDSIEAGQNLITEDSTFYKFIGLLFGKKRLRSKKVKKTKYSLWKNYPLNEIEI